MQAYIFVDYDNVRPIQSERVDIEADQNVRAIIGYAADIVKAKHAGVSELIVRLYGGWTDIAGLPTDRAIRIYRILKDISRRTKGFRVSVDLITSPILSDCRLVGLLRNGGQKMVDTLMVSDLMWCALSIECPLVVMSDDDDLTPGALIASGIVRNNWNRSPLCLSRRRPSGEGMNDSSLVNAGVYFGGILDNG